MPLQLRHPHNELVLAFLHGKSCHGDIIEPLDKYFRQYENVGFFCPNPENFGFACWYMGNRIIACAVGMQTVFLRISPDRADEIQNLSERSFEDLGHDWYQIKWNSPNLELLAAHAYNSKHNEKE